MKKKLFIIPALALMGVTALAGYTTYAEGMNQSMPSLTEEQQTVLDELREARESGEEASLTDEQRELLQEIRENQRTHMEKMHSLIEADDYEAFADAIEGSPMADIIDSEEKFEKLVEAHQLQAEAQAIMSELGLERQFGPHGPKMLQGQ